MILWLNNKTVSFSTDFLKLFFISCLVFLCQYFLLSAFSILPIVNFLVRLLSAYILAQIISYRFVDVYVKIVTFLSAFSIPFYLLNLLGIYIGYPIGRHRTIVLYNGIEETYLGEVRNSGPFWEPGAFAVYLNLALFFLLFGPVTSKRRLFMLVLVVALLTTKSTTGYIVFGIMLIFYFLKNGQKVFMITLLPVLLMLSKLDFIGGKITRQLLNASELDSSDVSWDRFGSALLDFHYIIKHPLIGNGFLFETRYSDHYGLYAATDLAGFGNGFTGMLGTVGMLIIGMYFILIYKNTRQTSFFWLPVIVIVCLQGEQMLNFIFFWILAFKHIYAEGSNITYSSQ